MSVRRVGQRTKSRPSVNRQLSLISGPRSVPFAARWIIGIFFSPWPVCKEIAEAFKSAVTANQAVSTLFRAYHHRASMRLTHRTPKMLPSRYLTRSGVVAVPQCQDGRGPRAVFGPPNPT